MDITTSQRHLFDVPEDVAYFNTAYNAPQLKASTERLISAAAEKGRPWQRAPKDFFDDAETVRKLASEIFGGDPNCYAIVPSASYGMSTAARAVEPMTTPGDRIVVLEDAFPSNYLPWERLSRETGGELITVAAPADLNWTRAILDSIDGSTRVVAVPHCHWTNGARIQIDAVAEAARSVGAMLAIDATQSLGAMPIPLETVRPDFMVAAGYKWLLCPYGFSLLYVGEPWHSARPLEETWLARAGADDFASLALYSPDYRPGARRFDVGQTCTPTILPGAIEALKQVGRWSVDGISSALARLNARIAEEADRLGLILPPPASRSPHLLGARLPEGLEAPMVERLAERNIYLSQRGSSLRIAPHLHVTPRDVDRLVHELSHLIPAGRRT